MGGGSRYNKKKGRSSAPASSSSLFSLFKQPTGRPSTQCRDNSLAVDDARSQQKSWRSDCDHGRYVGKPWIDREASEFIAKYHERQRTDV